MSANAQDEAASQRRKSHRVVVTRHGGPEVLQMVAEDLPEPGPGEVRVRVLAAGVSAYDFVHRSSGSTASILVNVSKNLTRMRISNLVALLNSLAIMVLSVMFYVVFYQQYRIIALAALLLFVADRQGLGPLAAGVSMSRGTAGRSKGQIPTRQERCP